MVNFHVLWDKKSQLAHAVCMLSDVNIESGLVLVCRAMPDGSFKPCGVFPIELGPYDFSTPFAIAVPQFEDQSVYLHFELFGGLGNESVHISEEIELSDPADPADKAPMTAQGRKWCIEDGAGQPNLFVFDCQDAAPDDTISQVYYSPRDGNTVLPCVSVELDGNGGVLELSAQLVDAQNPNDEAGDIVAELQIKTLIDETAPNTRIKCFTLSASLHVLALLEDDNIRLQREDNYCETELRVNSHLQGKVQMVLGKDLKDVWPDHEKPAPEAMHALGFLDRIVVETSPPATFVHRDNDGNLRPFGRNGIAILSLGANGTWSTDNGKLVDRIGREEGGFSVFEDSSFISKMTTHGYSINRADTQDAAEVSAFVFAWTSRRMVERLRGLGQHLRPTNFLAFRRSAEIFCALSGIAPNTLSARDGLGLRLNFAQNSAENAARRLGIKMLAANKRSNANASHEIVSQWASDSHLDGWIVFAAANNETVQHGAEAGLIFDASGLSMLLSQEDQKIDSDLQNMAQDLKLLLDAGIFSIGEKNILQSLEDIDVRKDSLSALKKNAVKTISSVILAVGPFETLADRPAALLTELARFQDDEDGLPPAPDRVSMFFAEATRREINGTLPEGAEITFSDRVGKMLREAIHESAKKIELLIKAGLKDPIKLDQDNSNNIVLGFGETIPSVFVSKIDEHLEQWLNETSSQPAAVNIWRKSLLENYNQVTNLRYKAKS